MQRISINELQHNLNLYLRKVKDGDEIIVEENDEIIARITPFDEDEDERKLVEQGLMSLPKKELTEDFWDADAP